MTTTHIPSARPRSRGLPIALGGTFAAIGTALALSGGAVLAIGGDDGMVESAHTRALSTPTSALVASVATVDGSDDLNGIESFTGATKIGVRSTSTHGGDVFVGVGPRAAVDRYLAGARVDEVTDLEVRPLRLDTKRHAGTRRPAPPAAQSFWAAKSTGATADLDWKVRDGDWRMVVMNADGRSGVSTVSRVEAGAEHLPTIGLAVLLAGVVTAAGGVAVMVGRR